MPRLRNEVTGAVMSVSESTAALLGGEWVSSEQKPEPTDAPKKRGGRTRKTDADE